MPSSQPSESNTSGTACHSEIRPRVDDLFDLTIYSHHASSNSPREDGARCLLLGSSKKWCRGHRGDRDGEKM